MICLKLDLKIGQFVSKLKHRPDFLFVQCGSDSLAPMRHTRILGFTEKSLSDKQCYVVTEVIGFNAQAESNTQVDQGRLL